MTVDHLPASAYIAVMEKVQSEGKRGSKDLPAVVTLAARKQARSDEIRAGISILREEHAHYARAHGRKFWLFGSAATGLIHYDSDVDVLVDFDEPEMAAALDFVERACVARRLRPDVSAICWCTPAFVDRIKPSAVVLS